MVTEDEQHVYDLLQKLAIPYVRHEHPAVFTVADAKRHWEGIHATHCKNLFLRNKKGDIHYLVILERAKQPDLKSLARQLGEDRLSFASSDRLMRWLRLTTGAVSPFGLMHDVDRLVRVIIDLDLKGAEPIAFHPNVNTATVSLSFKGFEKFLSWCGHSVRYIRM